MKLPLLGIVTAIAIVGTTRPAPAPAADRQDQASPTPVCIAIVLPNVQGVEGNATEFATAVRELFVSYLTGPSLKALALDARLPSQANEEARQKQCGRVLSVSLTRKAGGEGGGWFGRAVGQAGTQVAWGMPGGSIGSAAARGATAAAAQAVSEIASGTKARDEVQMEYKLTSLEGKEGLAPKKDKAKAKSDGEDLLTPLVAKAAEAIAAAASR